MVVLPEGRAVAAGLTAAVQAAEELAAAAAPAPVPIAAEAVVLAGGVQRAGRVLTAAQVAGGLAAGRTAEAVVLAGGVQRAARVLTAAQVAGELAAGR